MPLQNKLTYTKMKNKDGKVVAPTAKAFAAAAAGADWNSKPGYGVILANQPGAGTWPMTAATFILMYKTAGQHRRQQSRPEVLQVGLCQWRQDGPQASTTSRMPDKVVGMVENTWKQIQGWTGK